MSWLYDDGWIVDEETGEIINAGDTHPDDMLPRLAQRAKAAEEQRKAWESTERGYKRGILARLLPGQKVSLPDVGLTASVRQSSVNTTDMDALRAQLETMELTRAELLDLALAATGYDLGRIEGEAVKELVQAFTAKRDRAPYAVVDVLKRQAPKKGPAEE